MKKETETIKVWVSDECDSWDKNGKPTTAATRQKRKGQPTLSRIHTIKLNSTNEVAK